MENYTCVPDQSTEEKLINCLSIHAGSKMKAMISKAEQILVKYKNVKMSASGKSINKLVSIVEILKRNNYLFQYNHLSTHVQTDVWLAKEPLGSIKVEKQTPTLTITLSSTRLEHLTACTEQIPN